MIYTVTLNPALDKTLTVPDFSVGNVRRVTAVRTDAGGKGINVSKAVASFGEKSIAMGILAGNTGKTVADALTKAGIETDFCFVPGETRTNIKITDPVTGTVTDVNEPGIETDIETVGKLLLRLKERLTPSDTVILSGSLPRGIPSDTYRVWAECCGSFGAKVLLDADGDALAQGLEAAPFFVKPNDAELSGLFGKTLETPAALESAAKELIAGGVGRVMVSMGSRGLLYVTKEKTYACDALKVPVKSTVGAGDTVVAAFAVALLRGESPETTARFCSAAGAAAVMTAGTSAPTKEQVEILMPQTVCSVI